MLLPVPGTKSLFTFIFPPGWQPAQRHPILLSGDGGGTSNNSMAFLAGWEQTRAIATYVGQSTQQGRTGLIAALSNTGGRESAGWHKTALDDVAAMLLFMGDYGVDRSKVVHFGVSRGGGTALLWGENPLGLPDYTSIGVFAMSSPSHGGFITQQAMASYQGFAGLAISFFNDPFADRYDHVPRLVDVNPAPVLKLVLDEDHPWKVDCPPKDCPADTNRKSPAAYLSRLAGMPVVISLGTHEAPLPMLLKMDRTLSDRGIPHLTCLTLRTGHKGDATDCPRAEADRFLLALVTPGQSYAVPNTRRYFLATNLTDHPFRSAVGPLNQPTLPFAVTVPYRLRADQWATLAACGQNGKSYTAALTNSAGQVVFSVTGKTFGQNTFSDWRFDGTPLESDPECDVIRLDGPGGWPVPLAVDTYRWSFTFDGAAINPGNLSYQGSSGWGRPTVATTIIDSSQPPRQDAIFDPEAAITMGVDEF